MTTNDQPMDHAPDAEDSGTHRNRNDMERHFTSRSTWLRLVFMIVFSLLYGLSRLVIAAVVIIQFFCVLLTGEVRSELKSFGHSLSLYTYQIVEYLTFNNDTKPFPLDAPWPDSIDALRESAE
jgi:hypothetical protein